MMMDSYLIAAKYDGCAPQKIDPAVRDLLFCGSLESDAEQPSHQRQTAFVYLHVVYAQLSLDRKWLQCPNVT